MNTQRNTEPTTSDALTEDDLTLVVGGNTDPDDPTPSK
jgi:hypothetical protein